MAPILGLLLEAAVQTLLPTAVQAAKDKIAAGEVPPPSPAKMAVQATTAGIAQSKVVWVSAVIGFLGYMQDNQQLLTQLFGDVKTGTIMQVIALIMVVLRMFTGDSLHEAGGLTAPESKPDQTPSSPSL